MAIERGAPLGQVSATPDAGNSGWRLLAEIWLRPRRCLAAVARGPGWLWVAPLTVALAIIYLRLAGMVLAGSPDASATLAGGMIGILVGWLARACLLWAIGAVAGSNASLAQVYRLAAWAGFPIILRDAVRAVVLLSTGERGLITPITGPDGIASAILAFLLGRINLYSAWYVVLLFLAARVGMRLPRPQAILVVVSYVILALLPGLLLVFAEKLVG